MWWVVVLMIIIIAALSGGGCSSPPPVAPTPLPTATMLPIQATVEARLRGVDTQPAATIEEVAPNEGVSFEQEPIGDYVMCGGTLAYDETTRKMLLTLFPEYGNGTLELTVSYGVLEPFLGSRQLEEDRGKPQPVYLLGKQTCVQPVMAFTMNPTAYQMHPEFLQKPSAVSVGANSAIGSVQHIADEDWIVWGGDGPMTQSQAVLDSCGPLATMLSGLHEPETPALVVIGQRLGDGRIKVGTVQIAFSDPPMIQGLGCP